MFDSSGYRALSVFFRVYLHFDFIIFNAEDAALQKYVVQNVRSMVKAISEIGGISVQVSSQIHLMIFFNATQTAGFKIKHN